MSLLRKRPHADGNREPQTKSKASLLLSSLILAGGVLILCINAWLAIRSVQALSLSQIWVSHTWRVLDSLDVLTNSLKDAETSTGGYLLSGESKYLVPFRQAKAEMPQELETIRILVVEDPPQREALREVRELTNTRLSLLEQSIEERKTGRADSLHSMVLSETGLAEMDHLQSLVDRMRHTERDLLEQRVKTWQQDGRRAKETVVFSSAIDILLLFAMVRYILIQRRLREFADRTSNRLEKLQSITEVALTPLGVKELTAEIFARVQKALSADVALLCAPAGSSLRVEAASGAAIDPGTILETGVGDPLANASAQGDFVNVRDTAATPLLSASLSQRMRSMLIAPLSGSRGIGGILIAGRKAAHPFGHPEEEILRVAASRIALALDRRHAYEAEKSARQEAENRAMEVRSLNEELEQRVLERTAELEIANRELEAFSYSVSHDLRAPLRTIDGFSLALEEDYAGVIDQNASDYLRRIRDGVQRMGQLIDSLLQLSRITRADLLSEAVDLSALAKAVAADLRGEHSQRVLAFEIEPGLESVGDARLIGAALRNLLENAVKFTARQPKATIVFGRRGSAYFVKDNGAGFDMRYADKLFTAFNRLHGDREFRGSGIGLATVARIIRRHRGAIWAESEVGQGATFWFTLG